MRRGAARALLLSILAIGLVHAGAATAADGISKSRTVAAAVRNGSPRTALGRDSGLLFNGSRVTDFALNQSAPGAVRSVADPTGSAGRVLEMTVRDQDVYPLTPTANPRAQLLSPNLIRPGDEFWLATKFLIPEGYPSIAGWMSLVSVYGPPFGGPGPWDVQVRGRSLCWQRNSDYDWDIPWSEPIHYGEWTEVLLHERFATDGWVEMWIDGQPVTFFGPGSLNFSGKPSATRLEMATMDSANDAGPNAAKIMQYREAGMFEVGSVYFGSLRLGDTRAAVEAAS